MKQEIYSIFLHRSLEDDINYEYFDLIELDEHFDSLNTYYENFNTVSKNYLLNKVIFQNNVYKFDFTNSNMLPLIIEINSIIDDLGTDIQQIIDNEFEMNEPHLTMLNNTNDLYIFETFTAYLKYDHIAILLIEDDFIISKYSKSNTKLKHLSLELKGKLYLLSDSSIEGAIESGKPKVVNDLQAYISENDQNNILNHVLLRNGVKSNVTIPLYSNNIAIGALIFSSKDINQYVEFESEKFIIFSQIISQALDKNIYTEQIALSSIIALANLADARDNETGDHLNRIKKYSARISEYLQKDPIYKNIITDEFVDDIEKFSPLHDIGKVAISDNILLKPGKLDPEEFEIMKTHVEYGAKILIESESNLNKYGKSLFKMGIDITLGHHEKWNGTGYPNGLENITIPLSARIVAIADVFDALTSERPYKEAFTFDDSIRIINELCGIQFEPTIINRLMKNIDDFRELYENLDSYK